MLQLPNANQINAANVVDTVKALILAMQELADQSGSRDTVLLGEMREEIHGLRLETRAGFERLNEQMMENSQRLDKHENILNEHSGLLREHGGLLKEHSVELKTIKGTLQEHSVELKTIKGTLQEHTTLLKQIKTEFIAEQKETNSLLRELLAKK